jgi:transketolase
VLSVAEDLSGLFRGTDAPAALKDPGSGRGISAASLPAFVAGEELAELATRDDRIVVLTADLAHANRTIDFAGRHPARFFNLGVAEQNMVSVCWPASRSAPTAPTPGCRCGSSATTPG